MKPDLTLLKEQRPISIEDDADGIGYAVRFTRCNHRVWFAVRPFYDAPYYCAVCLSEFMDAVRADRAERKGRMESA
jgi:hypothetical protein